MRNTFPERIKKSFLTTTKKHRLLKIPMLVYVMAALGAYHFYMHIVSNGKRYASICVVILFCITSSSFTYHDAGIEYEQDNGADESEMAGETDSNIVLTPEETVDLEQVELLTDADVSSCYIEDVEQQMIEDERYTLDEILEENMDYQKSVSKKTEETVSHTDYTPVFDKDDWRLMLINKQHSIPEDYTFTLGTIKGPLQCDERIIEDLLQMLQAAKEEGVDLVIRSPYRDLSRQEFLFNRKVKRYMSSGMSYMEAYKLSSQTVTVPGASEHQLGLALDITSNSYVTLDAGFGDTKEGKWLAENCCRYGFILRYPYGKEYITGIEYEPWHFRYVGVEAATVIMEQGITLEEFWEELD